MTLFWIIAAGLVLVALGFVLPPLLKPSLRIQDDAQGLNLKIYRDLLNELQKDREAGLIEGEQFDRSRIELQRRLLEEVKESPSADDRTEPVQTTSQATGRHWTWLCVLILMPLFAVGLYSFIGAPQVLESMDQASRGVRPHTADEVAGLVHQLEQRMKQGSADPKGWVMLGKSYALMGRFSDAAKAYAKAIKSFPLDADVLADYADALAMSQGQSLIGEPEAFIARALKEKPDHAKSLALAGSLAFEKKDFVRAVNLWEKLLNTVPADSEMARDIQSSIKEAKAASTMDRAPQSVASSNAKTTPSSTRENTTTGLTGTVRLDASLASKVSPLDTLFIYARAAQGPRMPLAIVKKKVSDLPLTFHLDDATAMSPSMRLSSMPKVIVGARISKSGDAISHPGDLQGLSAEVSNHEKKVVIVIDTVVP
jgi:cytochrome c-type biogenesis protein CcmH